MTNWNEVILNNGLYLIWLLFSGFISWAFKKAFIEPVQLLQMQMIKVQDKMIEMEIKLAKLQGKEDGSDE